MSVMDYQDWMDKVVDQIEAAFPHTTYAEAVSWANTMWVNMDEYLDPLDAVNEEFRI